MERHSAEIAHSYSRDIFTFPVADDQKSRGCNWLLRTKSCINRISRTFKIFYELISEEGDKPQQTSIIMLLDENAQKYLIIVRIWREKTDQICNDLDFSINKAAMVLRDLEFPKVFWLYCLIKI